MAKKYYCSTCGIELIHTRRAVPGRGAILDLIDPHECEGFAVKANEYNEPTVKDLLDNLKPIGPTTPASKEREASTSVFEPGDRRKEVSTAPPNLLEKMRLERTGGE